MNIIQSVGFIILIIMSPVAVGTLDEFGANSIQHEINFCIISIGIILVILGAPNDKNQ